MMIRPGVELQVPARGLRAFFCPRITALRGGALVSLAGDTNHFAFAAPHFALVFDSCHDLRPRKESAGDSFHEVQRRAAEEEGRAMNQIEHTFDWVGQYLDWIQPDGWTGDSNSQAYGSPAQSSADVGEGFATAYLDWMDWVEPVRAAGAPYRAGARNSAWSGDDMAGLDVFEEALLAALRTESDCLQLLRGILDAGKTPPRIVKFASRTVAHAERLLEDERRAWRSLAALRRYSFAHSRAAWDPGDETQWPHALEEVAADVHALKGTVQAIQHH